MFAILQKSKTARIALSIAIGLLLAVLYFRVCSGGRCLVMGSRSASPVQASKQPDGNCYRFDRYNSACAFPVQGAAYVPGGSFQDPAYGSGVGSLGAVYEGFNVECLGTAKIDDTDLAFKQVSCQPTPIFNLPRDARAERQPVYPEGLPGVNKCQRRHPMNSIYAPPNEGIML